MCTLLKVSHHQTARGNHNAIFTERFNKFLNGGLRIFCNDHGTNRVFIEGAHTIQYAWNSEPVSGTDLSRSLLVCVREFQFPIDFTHQNNMSYNTDDLSNNSYANKMLKLMYKCRDLYELLINIHSTS